MRQNDMESLVSGIKQLSGVLVVVMPDCLLYSAWQRSGQAWDTESAGAYLGQLMLSNTQGVQAIGGWSGVSQVTLETDDALVVVRHVKDPFVVAYVFDAGTAIGWARLQIQRTVSIIEASLVSDDATIEVEEPLPARPMPKPTAVKPAPAPAARPVRTPMKPAPAPVSKPTPVAAKPAPALKPSPVAAKPAAPPPAAAKPAEPIMQPTGTGPNYGTPRPPEDSPAKTEQDLPKGTRLIKYLDQHAPDTHAALLRVSLQTGLPLTLLRMPDSLSDDEFAQVEESVRRILGVDQLNF